MHLHRIEFNYLRQSRRRSKTPTVVIDIDNFSNSPKSPDRRQRLRLLTGSTCNCIVQTFVIKIENQGSW